MRGFHSGFNALTARMCIFPMQIMAVLQRLIPSRKLYEMALTGEPVTAAEALELGLLNYVVPAAELDAALSKWVHSIVESGPKAIRLQKELIREWEAMPVNDAIEAGIRSISRAYQSEEPGRMIDKAIQRLKARKRG